jgi:hypothetical protein
VILLFDILSITKNREESTSKEVKRKEAGKASEQGGKQQQLHHPPIW